MTKQSTAKSAAKSTAKGVAGSEGETISAIDGLAGILVSANRIADRLQNAATGVDTNILLTDWLLLHALNKEGPLSMSKAAAKIGLTRQRVHQQASTLKAAGLIDISEVDSKTKTLSFAPAAKQLMAKLDRAFKEAIEDADGKIPEAPITTAFKSTRRIVRSMATKTAPRTE